MATLRTMVLSLLLAASLWNFPVEAQSLQCGDAVSLRTGRITVAASDIDDTDNIQCALDEAKRLRIPVVRLFSDVYYISSIRIEDFIGALEGRGRDETTLLVLNDSIDCAGMAENGRFPAALKFINGDVQLRWMTIGAGTPCGRPWLTNTSPGSGPTLLVHFTGTSAFAGCDKETGFGAVNRVNLMSVAPQSSQDDRLWGIGAFAEGPWFHTCLHTQLGALRLERSFLGGFTRAVSPALRGSASVDVLFSEFVDNIHDLWSEDANQRLTVQSNTMVKTEGVHGRSLTVHTSYDFFGNVAPFATKQDRAVIYRNTFSTESIFTNPVIAANGLSRLSLEIAGNQFGVTGSDPVISIWVTSGANITNNVFRGPGIIAVYLTTDWITPPATENNNVTGNDFAGFCPLRTDIFLGEGTSANIVGPGQNARVEDLGSGNYILGGFETPVKTDCDISSISQSDQVLAAKARYEALKSRITALLDSRVNELE